MPEIQFEGESFELASKVGLMPMMRFAHLAQKGLDSNDMEGLAAIYDLLRAVIADDAWGRFQEHAVATRADGDDLLAVVSQAVATISERPTNRPADSSDGPTTTSPSSAGGSSSRVVRRLEEQGRSDLALLVQNSQEFGSRASA